MSIFGNVLKKAGGTALGLIKNTVKSTPIGAAVLNTVSQVKSMSTATGSKKTTVSKAVTNSASKSAQMSKGGGGKGWRDKVMDWFKSQKDKNPVIYYIAWFVVIGISGLILYLIIRLVMWLGRKIFKRKSRATRTVRGYRPNPVSKAPTTYKKKAGKRKPSPAQLEALKKGRDALKRKRKR